MSCKGWYIDKIININNNYWFSEEHELAREFNKKT